MLVDAINKDLILSIDIGTTVAKVALFDLDLNCIDSQSSFYKLQTPDKFKVEIDPNKWWNGFKKALNSLKTPLNNISIITISANTPGLSFMNIEGNPLFPSILHMDRRSKKEANFILNSIGKNYLLEKTGNLPMLGGCSACGILWIKENYPDIYSKVYKFGHTNTFIAKRFTDNWAIDPSNTSLTCLYNTTTFGDWNSDIIDSLGIDKNKLPEIFPSEQIIGKLKKDIATDLGLKSGIPVLIGGNDAICAVLGAGVEKEGQMLDVIGTTELFNICTEKPIYSPKYSLRAHMLKNKWCTIYILNTGGKAIEWFYENFYKEMDEKYFFKEYLPGLLNKQGKDIPKFVPYLCGDRYSIADKSASFTRIKLNMNRDDFLLSILNGIALNTKKYVDEVGKKIKLDNTIYASGGSIKEIIAFKKKIFPKFDFKVVESSSLLGAAKLALMTLSK